MDRLAVRRRCEAHNRGSQRPLCRCRPVAFYGKLQCQVYSLDRHSRLSRLSVQCFSTSALQHWCSGECVYSAIWNANFVRIVKLLDRLGWELSGSDVEASLDKCRLVVSVYKHGPGDAAKALRAKHPSMLATGASWVDWLNPTSEPSPPSRLYDVRLNVSDTNLEEFSSAIVAFWKAAPDNITGDAVGSVPVWFEKAIATDEREARPKKGHGRHPEEWQLIVEHHCCYKASHDRELARS